MNKIVFVIGPQRTGTTWIYNLFCQQDEGVYIDRIVKENSFFSKRGSAKQSAKFLKRLSGNGEVNLYADVCSLYFGHMTEIKNIYSAFPNAKFVYARRDEESRAESFKEHRNFNKLSAFILGYKISNELYAVQSQFDEFSNEIKTLVGEENCLELLFDDLKSTQGLKWVEQLNSFLDTDLKHKEMGVVNASRKDSSLIKRSLFVLVRVLQFFKVHILVKKIKFFFQKR